ncbi:transcriptional regulator [Komagataeibacter diospyri]|nr:transcriptional regulator [Komagataeibacter diospyri]
MASFRHQVRLLFNLARLIPAVKDTSMPMLNALPKTEDWIEPDDVPRAIVTYGYAAGQAESMELDFHSHAKSQIMLVQRGALTCAREGGLWVVPPRSAIWIPGGTRHAIRTSGALEGYNAFIDPVLGPALPETCCAVAVTPLLRELLVRASELPLYYEENGANARLLDVLLDEIARARVEDLHLPMPADRRLRGIAGMITDSPGERKTLDIWARQAGVSERTLSRLISRETGMNFGRWRQQLSVMLAVRWLADGATIQQVAGDLGYESVPSFVTMFRKVLGTPPGRYMAERYAGRH